MSAQDLAPEHLILYSIPPEANLVFREVLIPAGVRPKRVTHIQLTEAIVELVKADLAVSVLPRWAVAPQLERGELVARSLTRAAASEAGARPVGTGPRRGRCSISSSSWRGTRSRSAGRRASARRIALALSGERAGRAGCYEPEAA